MDPLLIAVIVAVFTQQPIAFGLSFVSIALLGF